ncbi:MAG: metallophosphatase domain-containing protein [Bacteroidia bacterium]|nr:metallophosphatase domain-containing protein [Bacteroidia bacterium]
MKIVCISDTHGKHNLFSLPEGDMILHAGDFSKRGTEDQIRDFLKWFSALDYRHKVFIAGNHDFLVEREPMKFRRMIPENCIYLEDSGVEIEGIRFWGSPITPWFYDWAFNRHRGTEILPHWKKIPLNTQILITHGPPAGVLDQTFRGEKVGCRDLMDKISVVRPQIHLFGHIHEAAGMIEQNGTIFANASVLNLNYEPANEPIVLDW